MTISSQNRQAGPFVGNDTATAFPFAFKVFTASDLQVVRTNSAGVESTLALNTDYTASINSNQDSNPGGTVLLPAALVTGYKLTITSSIAPLQATDLTNQGGFYPRVITNALDKLTIFVQQILNGLGRSLKFPISDSGYNPTLPAKDQRRGRLLAFHETTGDPAQGPLITSIDTVTANVEAIDTVAASISDVNAVASDLASIGSVVDNAENINTVAGSIGNVNAVGASIADVNTAAANMPAIIAAPNQAANAASSATAANAANVAANAAKMAAEAARDAAQLSAGVYADTVAGLAATTNGQYFSVPSSNTSEYLILYLNSSGIAVQIQIYPSKKYVDGVLVELSESNAMQYTGSGPVYPIVTDDADRVLLGYDSSTNRIVAAGVTNTDDIPTVVKTGAFAPNGQAAYTGSGPVYPIVTDDADRVLLGYDSSTNRIVGDFGIPATQSLTTSPLSALTSPPVSKAINHLLFYGQSLSVGATATAVLSTSQPYSNITFNGGPRAWSGSAWDFSAFKPLVEDAVNPAPDGSSNRGETVCSGAANYASTLTAIAGRAPSEHVILASTAGHGGYRIDQLQKGVAWYSNLIAHINGAKALNADYALHAFGWVQGENDIGVTDYATYRARLVQLQADIEADATAISGQSSPVYCITYQLSFGIKSSTAQAFAQLDLAQKSEKFALATPCYHLPFATDNVHLTNVGYKWLGAYFGRAYKQIAIDGKRPKFLNPVSATRRGSVVRVRFDAPTLPLVLDTSTLAVTTDYGFKVLDGVSIAAISSVEIDEADVVITLAAVPTGTVKIRYALDYAGSGLTITNGASGNLRDSTPDTITIAGTSRPLYHVAPHFELTATVLGE